MWIHTNTHVYEYGYHCTFCRIYLRVRNIRCRSRLWHVVRSIITFCSVYFLVQAYCCSKCWVLFAILARLMAWGRQVTKHDPDRCWLKLSTCNFTVNIAFTSTLCILILQRNRTLLVIYSVITFGHGGQICRRSDTDSWPISSLVPRCTSCNIPRGINQGRLLECRNGNLFSCKAAALWHSPKTYPWNLGQYSINLF